MAYELVKLDLTKQENRTPEYLAVHPFGEVPALVDGDITLFESLAICLHLADRFPEKRLAPPLGSAERGHYYQWMVFAEASLEPAVLAFYPQAQRPAEAQAGAELQEVLAGHRVRIDTVLDVVDAELGDREFIAAGHFTAADLVLASILHLANTLKLLDRHPRLVTYLYRHCQRPALMRAVSA